MPLHILATFMDKGPPKTHSKGSDDGSEDQCLIIEFQDGMKVGSFSVEQVMEIIEANRKDWMTGHPSIEIQGNCVVVQF